MDGRRHSIDIPISKTLLALRRVRSLRDPSTHFMGRFSPLVDNLNWDTNSFNAITLGFVNSCEEDGMGNAPVLEEKKLGLSSEREEKLGVLDLHNGLRKPNSNLLFREDSTWVGNNGSLPITSKQVVDSSHFGSNQEMVSENKSLSGRYCNGYTDKGLDLTCGPPSSSYLGGVGSCNEPIERSLWTPRLDHNTSTKKTHYQKPIRSSREAVSDIMSRVGSPCLSRSNALEGSTRSTSLFGNEDRTTCCWSGTPRFRESNIPSDGEDLPLLSREGKSLKHLHDEVALCSESPQSFSLKFRPKSFCELVGQNEVARSLLSAISNGRIVSLYLFHGPRGTGKTTTSRIFAAALNCHSLEETKPCGLCHECVLFFSGRSQDVNEVDSVRINRKDRVRSIIKNATIPPVSSRFKIFVIDECHLLRRETWATILNNLENFSRYAVFLMTTPDLNKLPQRAVSRSQKYHLPKIKEVDISSRLGKICMEEGLEFEQFALDFIATKSDGSLRDAEMVLEQLSLLGKRITMPLVYELIGIVSDDELLDLLDLALSSDSSNTVRRARELMRSRIDPMQLISQLANLIMDVLAGKCQPGSSEVRRKFFSRYTSEANLQQLNHALKILSETEKQLRASKSQTTWLIVALLQLSSAENSFLDANDLGLCERIVHPRDGDFCSASSRSESSKHPVTCVCHSSESCQLGMQDGKETLESIWKKAIETCQSNSLKNNLMKHGKMSSICFNQGLAVVELEFHHPDYVNKAEKSWKMIANALQSILGCNVEMRINLVHCASVTKYAKKKPSFSLFSCTRRLHQESATENRSEPLCDSDFTSGNANTMNKCIETCSPCCGSQLSPNSCQRKKATIRTSQGNALSIGMTSNCKCKALSAQEEQRQRGCLFRSLKTHKKMESSETSQFTCMRFQPESNLALSTPRRPSTDTYCLYQ